MNTTPCRWKPSQGRFSIPFEYRDFEEQTVGWPFVAYARFKFPGYTGTFGHPQATVVGERTYVRGILANIAIAILCILAFVIILSRGAASKSKPIKLVNVTLIGMMLGAMAGVVVTKLGRAIPGTESFAIIGGGLIGIVASLARTSIEQWKAP